MWPEEEMHGVGRFRFATILYQFGIKYSLNNQTCCSSNRSESFELDLENFIAVCRVVKGLRNVRIGAVGARPGAFNTVRYSEKILQRNGISVVTIDLSQILGFANKLTKDDGSVKQRLEAIGPIHLQGVHPRTGWCKLPSWM